jgi:hypothetical protein
MIPVRTHISIPYTNNGGRAGAVAGEVIAINGQLQVYDGSAFVPITATSWVDSIELGTVVEWAKQKMEHELREEEMARQFPAFAKAKENYEMIRRLVENELA